MIEIIDVIGDRREALLNACVEIGEAEFDDLRQVIDLVFGHR